MRQGRKQILHIKPFKSVDTIRGHSRHSLRHSDTAGLCAQWSPEALAEFVRDASSESA